MRQKDGELMFSTDSSIKDLDDVIIQMMGRNKESIGYSLEDSLRVNISCDK